MKLFTLDEEANKQKPPHVKTGVVTSNKTTVIINQALKSGR